MEKLLTKDDLAGLLQVDKRTVDRLAADGILPPGRKIGRSVRWLGAEVEAAIRTAPSAAPLVALRFVERLGPYNRGETAGFPEAEAAIALSAGVAELVNLTDDFPRVRRHLLELAKLQAERLAAVARAGSEPVGVN